ncbi:MAG: NAD(P)-dependent oxidoreductase [Victivallales bacterium]|nr:NAD(P)-dependent oxidoreductase [Victivallales bacterium]
MKIPDRITSEEELEILLSEPHPALIEMMKRLDGDIMILGVAGKMGVTMAMQAKRAVEAAGVRKRIVGVARFSKAVEREKLENYGIETIVCDLLDREAVSKLPKIKNIIFMAGRKFGTEGSEPQTWAMNALAPANVAEHFADSRLVVFSSGNIYPMRRAAEGGCTEDVVPMPIGEYAQSCLARERIFEYFSQKNGTKLLLFRLNYAVDLRYGVLHDICRAIWEDRPVDNTVGYFNVIWQGDANAMALRCLELADNPRMILNVTGPEQAGVEETALAMGRIMGRPIEFSRNACGDLSLLSNSSKMQSLLGKPRIGLEDMICLQAQWIMDGGVSLGKPTYYEINNGKF